MIGERWEVTMPTNSFTETTSEIVREVAADVPQIFGIGLETAIAAATGAGGLGLIFGGLKLAKVLFRKDRKTEVTAGDSSAPFPRYLDEARELRELRNATEGRIPEFDTLVGRVVQDEIESQRATADEQTKTILAKLWLDVRNRVDSIAPISIKQYLPKG